MKAKDAIEHLRDYDPEREIALIIWQAEDVQMVADVTWEEAEEVVRRVDRKHDANIGVPGKRWRSTPTTSSPPERRPHMSDDIYRLVGTLVGSNDAMFCAEVAEALLDGGGLSRVSGVGERRKAVLEAALTLSRVVAAERALRTVKVCTRPQDLVELLLPRIQGVQQEVFFCIALNTKNRVLAVKEVSVGSLNASIVHPRELYRKAVDVGAASIVVAHNHPSGDTSPSGADIQLTRRLSKAGDALGIELLDHVIIADDGRYTSMRDTGAL